MSHKTHILRLIARMMPLFVYRVVIKVVKSEGVLQPLQHALTNVLVRSLLHLPSIICQQQLLEVVVFFLGADFLYLRVDGFVVGGLIHIADNAEFSPSFTTLRPKPSCIRPYSLFSPNSMGLPCSR